jgi:hypothetical protein
MDESWPRRALARETRNEKGAGEVIADAFFVLRAVQVRRGRPYTQRRVEFDPRSRQPQHRPWQGPRKDEQCTEQIFRLAVTVKQIPSKA